MTDHGPALRDLIGFVAAALTTISFFPQVLQTIRTKDTAAISLTMYLVFTAGTGLWLIYGIILGSLPMILCNAITVTAAAIVLGLKLRHG
ncbi:MAG TPA: SemiSWEET transporter [Kofleriaceae bacterium]|nr:SemiSWEET transporter [Kofleriaceae bacterium]